MNKRAEYKTLGDVVGMPTEFDRSAIQLIITEFNKKNPGLIRHTIEQARKDQADNSTVFKDLKKFGEVDTQSGRRLIFELPQGLVSAIEHFYPTMFRDKRHFHWFVRNFKYLMVPEKY